ncbi:MAG TPA: hypothetical protein VLC49_06500 [Solirubrobacteraceae bacterium]|nr:hypothetical protein [Solirubrobacteraceae bacterium]
MRRSIVFSVLLVACAAAIWILALAGPAAGAPRSPHIICPQQQQPNVVPPCCPLPPKPAAQPAQPICCQSTACCQTTPCCQTTCCSPTTCPTATPTVTSSPNPSRAGQQVVISGSATSGAEVALWRKLAHQSSFHQVSTTIADGSGKYTFTLKRGTVMADQEWYVTSSGQQSATVAQLVEAVVAVSSSAKSTVVGHPVVLRGHVTPSHAGQVVLVEISRAGGWQVIARPRLGHGSTYSVTHRFAKSGAVKLRAVLQSDSRNGRSTSRTVTVTVKP